MHQSAAQDLLVSGVCADAQAKLPDRVGSGCVQLAMVAGIEISFKAHFMVF
jgi:hypothetical protein